MVISNSYSIGCQLQNINASKLKMGTLNSIILTGMDHNLKWPNVMGSETYRK